MDRAKRNHELEVETWSEKREQVTDELEQLQAAMIADGTIWSEDNTARCATLIGDLKFIKVKLHVRGPDDDLASCILTTDYRSLKVMIPRRRNQPRHRARASSTRRKMATLRSTAQ